MDHLGANIKPSQIGEEVIQAPNQRPSQRPGVQLAEETDIFQETTDGKER